MASNGGTVVEHPSTNREIEGSNPGCHLSEPGVNANKMNLGKPNLNVRKVNVISGKCHVSLY